MKTITTFGFVAIFILLLGFDTSPDNKTQKKKRDKTAFGAHVPTHSIISNATETTLTGYSEEYDRGNAFDPVTGAYTAPEDGIYAFSTHVYWFKDVENLENIPTIMRIKVNGFAVIGSQKFDRVSVGNNYGESTSLFNPV